MLLHWRACWPPPLNDVSCPPTPRSCPQLTQAGSGAATPRSEASEASEEAAHYLERHLARVAAGRGGGLIPQHIMEKLGGCGCLFAVYALWSVYILQCGSGFHCSTSWRSGVRALPALGAVHAVLALKPTVCCAAAPSRQRKARWLVRGAL